MPVTAKFNKKLPVHVSEKMWEEVKQLADEQGVSYAEIVRKALEVGLPEVRHRESS